MIFAPPKSGKSLLGMLAAAKRVKALRDQGYVVVYVNDVGDITSLLSSLGAESIADLALKGEASMQDETKPTIIYYFDEAHELPQQVYSHFVKHPRCYCIFSTSGTATKGDDCKTPSELVQNSFYCTGPADREEVRTWLMGRLFLLFDKGINGTEVLLGCDLLNNMCNGHIGLIQHLGCIMQGEACNSYDMVRTKLRQKLLRPTFLYEIRLFGSHNGNLREALGPQGST